MVGRAAAGNNKEEGRVKMKLLTRPKVAKIRK
jgi:hypothetical protein